MKLQTVRISDRPELGNSLKRKNLKGIYCIPNRYFEKLLAYPQIPIKNRNIFILNVLSFMQHLSTSNFGNLLEPVSVHRNKLIGFFGTKYIKYLEILSILDIVSRVPHKEYDQDIDSDYQMWYKPGKYSCNYKVHNDYILDDDVLIVFVNYDEKVKEPLIINVEPDLNLPDEYINCLANAEIDVFTAIYKELDFADSERSLVSRVSALLRFVNYRFANKGANVDRIYSSFTGLSRVSRPYLTIRGQKFVYLDMVNAQPMLMAYYLKVNGYTIDDDYLKDTQDGKLYEKFVGMTMVIDDFTKDRVKLTRDEVKVQLFRSIYFAFNPYSKISKKFKKLYPKTYESLREISTYGRSNAFLLQNLEASIFNYLRPLNSKYYFTLFDAIYFTDPSDADYLIDQIKRKFYEVDLTCTVKLKDNVHDGS